MEQDPLYWIALYTKSRQEKNIADQLDKAGIEAYVPARKERRRWSDRYKWIESALIPSYVFVHTNPSDYLRIFTVPGIVRVVMFNGRIARIRDCEIELLRKATKSPEPVEVSANEFSEQDEVKIISGPFAGYKGRVAFAGNRYRVGISIEELGTSIIVEVPKYDICPLAAPAVEV